MDSQTNKYRLLFLTVNCSFSHSSLALPLLHNACRELDSWEWVRCDTTNTGNVLATVQAVCDARCDLVVADLYLFNRQMTLDILQRYHAIDPACRIAVGGPECLGEGAAELLKDFPWLDCVFRGEGEEEFRNYLANFTENASRTHYILPADGCGVYENWAASPYPATSEFFVTDKPFVQIETSRGCPMKCFYCTSGNTRTRYRSLEQVAGELQLLSAKGVKEIRVLDRTFNLPQKRGAELLRMFREDFPHIKFHLELHPQFLDEAMRRELEQALPGQLHIEVGVQCLDKNVQDLSGRCSDRQAVLDGLAFLCCRQAFATHADLLAGMPGQKLEHILADTADLMKLGVAEIQLEVLKVLPGTPLRKIAETHGIKYSRQTPYDVMMSNTMSLSNIETARALSRLLDLTYNNHFLHQPVREMLAELPETVSKLLEFFHQANGSSTVVWDLKKRFLFLNDFCINHQLVNSRKALAYQWLLAGFLPGQGPDIYSRKAADIPPEARLTSGNAECLHARESRYWSFALPGRLCYIAYNRQYNLNRPAAIWSIEL
ncbi:MAG: DUF4080 domain-containing protein [Lentisphaeria bacterium]|nr:DUF4080 domain-containing protein [Lentisphaeria bacterium]